MAFIPVIINFVFILTVFKVIAIPRERAKAAAAEQGRQGARAKMFDEETQEAENDISSLALSFLTTQVARYQFSGVLANTLGLEEPELPKSMGVIQMLYGFAVVSAVLTVFWVFVKGMG